MPNYKLKVSYDGTNYCGFQIQENGVTVQEKIEEALYKIYGKQISIFSAGRTDSGVHARGQVINFMADKRVPPAAIPTAINGIVPKDIVIYEAEEVEDDFHARRSARSKLYTYNIDNGFYPDVLQRLYVHHVRQKLDLEAMEQGAQYLLGRHDFTSFKSNNNSTIVDFVREIYRLDFTRKGELIVMSVEANGFLYKMVRIIAGTLIEVGKRRIPPINVKKILELQNRRSAGPTAPPQGLSMHEVFY